MAAQHELELCQEILGLAIRINMQPTYSVWAEFHGHVDTLEVRVSKKWKEGEPDIEGWSCFGDDNTVTLSTNYRIPSIKPSEIIKGRVKALEKLKRELSKFLVGEVAQ